VLDGDHVAEGLVLRHQLRILGCPRSRLICRHHRAEAALEVHANLKLEQLQVEANQAICIRHHAGRLQVHMCRLVCLPSRFAHLFCALLSCGNGGPMTMHLPVHDLCDILVEATRIIGAQRAIVCKGSGVLRDVRLCDHDGDPIYWFKVRRPQHTLPELLPVRKDHSMCNVGLLPAKPVRAQPSCVVPSRSKRRRLLPTNARAQDLSSRSCCDEAVINLDPECDRHVAMM
jgi:hypothetical protein